MNLLMKRKRMMMPYSDKIGREKVRGNYEGDFGKDII
jgi:hypothetical protein